jgi:hypothetical protein
MVWMGLAQVWFMLEEEMLVRRCRKWSTNTQNSAEEFDEYLDEKGVFSRHSTS